MSRKFNIILMFCLVLVNLSVNVFSSGRDAYNRCCHKKHVNNSIHHLSFQIIKLFINVLTVLESNNVGIFNSFLSQVIFTFICAIVTFNYHVNGDVARDVSFLACIFINTHSHRIPFCLIIGNARFGIGLLLSSPSIISDLSEF